jgi:glycosyltransferase involved in cell wall biosynthesis
MPRRLRLLWVTPYTPRRGVSAARGYWWSLLARLATRHDVSLLTFADPEEVDVSGLLPPGLAEVHQVPRSPWRPEDPLAMMPRTVAGAFSHPDFATAVRERLRQGVYDLVQYEFIEMGHLVPPESPVPTILSVHQLSYAAERAHWRGEGGSFRRGLVFLHRYLRDLDFELRAVRRAHHVIAVSAEDAARLRSFHPDLRVHVSPVGVDCAYFRPVVPAPPPDTDMLFVGNFIHPPNADAVFFLVREVLPHLNPSERLRIIGHGVPREIAALGQAANIEVAGSVPDLRPHLAGARAVVAPVRFGTGMRGKVLEGLAMGRPVVTTSLGAEGLGAISGQHLVVADDARQFAAAIHRILAEPEWARELGAEGRNLAERRFSWDTIAAALEDIYEQVLSTPGPTPTWAPDPAVAWGPTIARLGRRPANGVGAAVLLARGIGWHLHRQRTRRFDRSGSPFAPARGETPA